MNILVVSYYDETLVPVVEGICRKLGGKVSDWFVAYASQHPAIQPQLAFPGAVVHRPDFASRGMFSPGAMTDFEHADLDQTILDRMAAHENMFMRLLDIFDPTGISFSGRERREAYFSLLRFCLAVFRARPPQLMIIGTIPHSLHDYLLYGLCREFSVPVLTYVPISLPGYLLLQESVSHGSRRLVAHYQTSLAAHDGGEIELPAPVAEHFDRLRMDYRAAEPWYVKLRDHRFLRPPSPRDWLPSMRDRNNYLRRGLSRGLWLARTGIGFARHPVRQYQAYFREPLADYFKLPGVPLSASLNTRYRNWLVFRNGAKPKRELYKQYLSLQVAPDLDAPFVFIPLHYQPEASTSPLGGAFLDQNLMIRLIASHLPEGWRIYVKEHRTTFDPQLRGHFARDAGYYPEIAAIPNTHFVPMTFSSFDLMDRAKAVATVTGTAGWEAVVRGVPTIVFGNAWYKDCEGVFDGRDGDACASALKAIEAGFRPDHTRVRLFAKCATEIGIYADRDTDYILTTLTSAQSRNALIEHFCREYLALYGNAPAEAK